jgi:hypothetical protein
VEWTLGLPAASLHEVASADGAAYAGCCAASVAHAVVQINDGYITMLNVPPDCPFFIIADD